MLSILATIRKNKVLMISQYHGYIKLPFIKLTKKFLNFEVSVFSETPINLSNSGHKLVGK